MSNESHTVAVGVVPNRRDGLISLHIDNAFVLLSPREARKLASTLNGFAGPEPDSQTVVIGGSGGGGCGTGGAASFNWRA